MNLEGKSLKADNVDVLIHTDDALSETSEVIRKLTALDGVAETRFSPKINHLLMVTYSPKAVNASKLLRTAKELGHKAQLVGL